MMRAAYFAFLLCAVSAVVAAQPINETQLATEQQDVIVLKNGAVIIGQILSREEGKKLTIRLRDGKTMEVPYKKIAEITKSDSDWAAHQKRIQDSQTRGKPVFLPARRVYQLRAGGQVAGSKGGGSVSAAAGVLSPRNTFAGVSVGYERNSDSRFVPLMCELEYFFSGHRASPFLSFGVGYSIGWLDAYPSADYGGLRIQFGLGSRIIVSVHDALTLRLTAGSQQIAKTNVVTESHIEVVNLTVGLLF